MLPTNYYSFSMVVLLMHTSMCYYMLLPMGLIYSQCNGCVFALNAHLSFWWQMLYMFVDLWRPQVLRSVRQVMCAPHIHVMDEYSVWCPDHRLKQYFVLNYSFLHFNYFFKCHHDSHLKHSFFLFSVCTQKHRKGH